MNTQTILKRIDIECSKKGIARAKALIDSGVGKDFAVNLQKGSKPSIEKCQALAVYFGVSLDYLVGNTDIPDVNKGNDTLAMKIARIVTELPPESQEQIYRMIEAFADSNKR